MMTEHPSFLIIFVLCDVFYLKGKHDEKLSAIFMSLSCSYVCIHTPEIFLPSKKEPFTLEIWGAKDLIFNYFLLWAGLHGAVDRGTAALVYHCPGLRDAWKDFDSHYCHFRYACPLPPFCCITHAHYFLILHLFLDCSRDP